MCLRDRQFVAVSRELEEELGREPTRKEVRIRIKGRRQRRCQTKTSHRTASNFVNRR